MGRLGRTRAKILGVLADGVPMSCREIMEEARLGRYQAYNALSRAWKGGYILRTKKPLYSHEHLFKGRGGLSQHTRPFHLYLLRPEDLADVVVDGQRYVGFSEEHLDSRGGSGRVSARARKRCFDYALGDHTSFN